MTLMQIKIATTVRTLVYLCRLIGHLVLYTSFRGGRIGNLESASDESSEALDDGALRR